MHCDSYLIAFLNEKFYIGPLRGIGIIGSMNLIFIDNSRSTKFFKILFIRIN